MIRGLVRTAMVAIAWAIAVTAHAEDSLGREWRDLFTRCRVAIESGAALDTDGLDLLGQGVRVEEPFFVPGVPVPIFPGCRRPERRWGANGQRFIITEDEWPGRRARRGCWVGLAPAARELTTGEEADLAAAFKAEREALLAEGRHERWDPDPVFAINLGMRLDAANGNGCRVVSLLMIEPRGDRDPFFTSGSGEQAGDCGGRSLLKPGDVR